MADERRTNGSERRSGPGRRRTDRVIHPWRWRMLTVWIVIFTLAVGYGIRNNRDLIHRTQDQSAKVESLQQTNCGLTLTLLTARLARWQQYKESHRKSDLRAVVGYEKLIKPELVSSGNCKIPQRLKIPDRPLLNKEQ